MPLINGQKMACEPCIRGHRSTKCTHANERLMVPVRKPGRPLSTCPHPASRPCSCGRVTAAIPKKQPCRCGSNKSAESPTGKPENGDSASESTSQSPSSKTTSSSYRVQKTSSRSSVSSRRPSVDPAALQRMDPGMLNIMPAYDGISQKPAAPLPEMSPYGAMGMTPAESPFGPVMYPMFQPHMPPPMMSADGSKPVLASHGVSMATPHIPEETREPVAKGGSCCGGGNADDDSAVPSTLPSMPSPPTKTKPKSCCSSSINSPKPDQKSDTVPTSDVSTPNGMVMSPFPPTPIMMPNGMYAYYPQPTVFTYPPQYGSYLQPLQPEQWRQVMASMTFAGQGGMPSPYGMPYPPPGTPHSAAGTSHQCSCGASCQCIGCAAHPYNEATQNYVRSAWQSMMEDPQRAQTHSSAGYTHVNGHGNAEMPTTNGSGAPTVPAVGPAEGTVSPVAPQTPSEAASGVSEEQALSANDFFFVSYPFGDSCAGEQASCPCGDDCQCLGCVIHNNSEVVAEGVAEA
ncbi:Copper-fist domain-containing protein [Fusarium keratoplasticum]|uniref:Copper-fist domain-containing protein n=1 Tax=Fusarium keratoplasticum TaxID=1328300 RepID=A0ACC0R3Z6_9HYPO|nr:Copper-fist domain-containing protein [Fusarium keratoplasticum]KAI8674913.1 Copper-fist domain-containing protein [Fusarium keratoplasticum]